VFDNGVYEGELKEVKMNGKGKYLCTEGAICEGDWKDHKNHGKGLEHLLVEIKLQSTLHSIYQFKRVKILSENTNRETPMIDL
jgi:hypothetical protein